MYSCQHVSLSMRWRNRKAGLLGQQCNECGRAVGRWVKHSDVEGASELPDWMPEPVRELQPERVPMAGPEDSGHRPRYVDPDAYRSHLNSPEWKRMRAKVLKRSNGLCEGCLEAPAAEVHHLTYRNLFAELAFQLVALCRDCHEQVHGDGEIEGRQ